MDDWTEKERSNPPVLENWVNTQRCVFRAAVGKAGSRRDLGFNEAACRSSTTADLVCVKAGHAGNALRGFFCSGC